MPYRHQMLYIVEHPNRLLTFCEQHLSFYLSLKVASHSSQQVKMRYSINYCFIYQMRFAFIRKKQIKSVLKRTWADRLFFNKKFSLTFNSHALASRTNSDKMSYFTKTKTAQLCEKLCSWRKMKKALKLRVFLIKKKHIPFTNEIFQEIFSKYTGCGRTPTF